MQTRKNLELSIIPTSLIFLCELARINFCPPRSSTGKWVVLRRELGGNAVEEKSVAVGIGVGYQEDPRWAKKSTPPVRGGFWKTTWAVLYLQTVETLIRCHILRRLIWVCTVCQLPFYGSTDYKGLKKFCYGPIFVDSSGYFFLIFHKTSCGYCLEVPQQNSKK